jgi:hypothetical protein
VGNSVAIREVELPEIAEIRRRKALAVSSRQLFSQSLDQGLTVVCSLTASLKRFNHLTADVPIG